MNWERHLLRHESKRGALRDLLAPYEFVTENSFLTKAGHVGCILRVSPVAFECLDPSDLEYVAGRFEAAIRHFDPAMRVYQYLMKRNCPAIPHRRHDDARALEMEARAAALYSIEIFMAVVFEEDHESKPAHMDEEIRIGAALLEATVTGVIEGLSGAVPVKLLGKHEAFAFLRALVNYSPDLLGVELEADHDLDRQIGGSSLDCAGALKLDGYFVRVLTLKDAPHSTIAHCLRGLYVVPCCALVATEWKPEPVARVHKEIHGQRRHFTHTKESLTAGKKLIDEGKQGLIDQLGESQRAIELNGIYIGHFSLTVILYSEDAAVLRKAATAAHNALQQKRGALAEQVGKSALVAWLAVVPGNRRFSIRAKKVTDQNYADLSFLFGADTGEARNHHLRDEYLALVENNHGQPFYLNLHAGDVAHTLITGQTGAGKTFLLKFLVAAYQKYSPYTCIFDIAHSFRGITARFHGAYTQLGESRINPFCLDPTGENLGFLFSFVRLLIESDKAGPLGNHDALDLYEQIRKLYRSPARLRRLGNLALAPHLDERLNRWVYRETFGTSKAGQFATLFDNEVDNLTLSDFQCFDFPEMKRHREAIEALVFYVLHQSARSIDKDPGRPKLIVMDEAWQFLQHSETRDYIQRGLKTWRKKNAALVLATHSLADLETGFRDSIIESCATKIHGPNPGIDMAAWREAFHLNETQAELIATLVPRRQFLVQDSGVINLKVGAQHEDGNISGDGGNSGGGHDHQQLTGREHVSSHG